MTWLLAMVLLAQEPPCEHPALSSLSPSQRTNACRLLTEPAPVTERPAGLSSIYEREGFERARQRNSGTLQTLLAQARAWLERLFATSGAETYSNLTRVAVLGAALAIAVTVVVRVAGRRRAGAASTTAPVVTSALDLEDPAVHLERAEALLDTQPREAIREGWLAVLSTLERRRFARPDRVKTNREVISELPARGAPPELVKSVDALVGWFDRAFYSLDAIAPEQARAFLADVGRLARPT